jgi:hypothetical protein
VTAWAFAHPILTTIIALAVIEAVPVAAIQQP